MIFPVKMKSSTIFLHTSSYMTWSFWRWEASSLFSTDSNSLIAKRIHVKTVLSYI